MRLVYTPEQEALRDELRSYFKDLLPPEVKSQIHFGESGGEMYRKVIRQMGTDGWLGIGWPKEYGGQLGEAYVHGMNGISEGVRQVRGTSVNQVDGDGAVLVTAGTGVPTSGLILTSDN